MGMTIAVIFLTDDWRRRRWTEPKGTRLTGAWAAWVRRPDSQETADAREPFAPLFTTPSGSHWVPSSVRATVPLQRAGVPGLFACWRCTVERVETAGTTIHSLYRNIVQLSTSQQPHSY
ncbi:hypothetical protein BDW59DRAFT_99608 [Aspergillus cavernicola]|uniref:Uncharacterized protein n=1 Tax=Aspergillus cavernicola TaxID=176166 RepID=A0ABR4I5X7_9EURO